MNRITRRDWLKAGAVGLGAATVTSDTAAFSGRADASAFAFHHDHVLGTSLDLRFIAPDAGMAEHAERVALAEIERLRQVFSLYDPTSELSRLNASSEPVRPSPDLRAVLREYERWWPRAGGACNPLVGTFVRLWTQAERAGQVPDANDCHELARLIDRPGWRWDAAASTVARCTPYPLDLNAAAKGYIIGRAAAAVRAAVPGVAAGLVNLGGDLTAWGTAWPVAIQDPFTPFDNAPPLGGLWLRDAAVATSGGYQRFFTIDGIRYSHLIDPRIGRPTDGVASATVVAADSMTANVLATTLCVLGPDEGVRLVATVPGAACLIVTADGRHVASPSLRLHPVSPSDDETKGDNKKADGKKADDKPPKADPWPAGFQVTVAVELLKFDNARRYRRPYTAVWIEDANGKAIRTLGVWGNSPKYLKDLASWWKFGRDDRDLVKAVTRATRGPGKYDLVWDGKDDKGHPLGQGTYTVRVEVTREHGEHVRQAGKINCGVEAASIKMEKTSESGETAVDYKKKQP
ncbi:MAG: DUF2271 domain-containing protein [Gemmataceae bacterium]